VAKTAPPAAIATAAAPRPRGRPRDPERLARVLEAAKQQFTQHGFEAASIDAIAESSGVSKVTIYSYFPTKAALFQAAITHRMDATFGEEGGLDWKRLDPQNPAQALTQIGRGFIALMRSPDVVQHHRSLYGAIGQDPAAAQNFFAAGPQQLTEAVARYLAAADAAHALAVPDPHMAANQFLSLFLGLGHIRALLGLAMPTRREDEALVRSNVELALRAFAPRSAPAGRRAAR
jgi:TetR/AcrR family transcriptional repressor of mexJK operon